MKKNHQQLSFFYSNKRSRYRLRRLRKGNVYSGSGEQLSKKPRIVIKIPEYLDLDKNRNDFLDLIEEIQKTLLNEKRFIIDHRFLKSITMEALLILTSEIERCTKISEIKLYGRCEYTPQSSYVKSLLNKIGYWDYFNIDLKNCKAADSNSNELFLQIVGDTVVSGEKIGGLIEFFESLICFDIDTRDKFSDAMMEAAANTVEHAYTKSQDIDTLNKWWLTASLDRNTNEISFIFYDQGLGILNTLQSSKTQVRLKELFTSWFTGGVPEEEILKRLVTTNLSSYKDDRRGNGLMSFKTFIDQVEDGELTIYTDNLSYSAISESDCKYQKPINGTLIAWKIKANQSESKCMFIKGVDENEISEI